MKKLLNFLLAGSLLTTSLSSVISCNKPKVTSKKQKETNNQKDMLEGADFISRLVVASRHENLNYNLNEILSMYLTPNNSVLKVPTSYVYNNQEINVTEKVSKFKRLLEPNLDLFDDNHFTGMYASYVMGMYDNEFYSNFITEGSDKAVYFNDTFSKEGNTGNNKRKNNATGYAAGLNRDIDLAKEKERRSLSWGIQDTGALTNFLLVNGLDGGFPGDANSTTSPMNPASDRLGGTNGGGYAWYNSLISSTKGNKNANGIKQLDVNQKLKNKNIKLIKNENKESFGTILQENSAEVEFNNTGSLLVNTAGALNFNAHINNIGSFLDNIFETESGAMILGELMSYLLPVVPMSNKNGFDAQAISQVEGFKLVTSTWSALKNIIDNENVKKYLQEFGLDISKKAYFNLDNAPNPGSPIAGNEDQIGFDKLYGLMPNDKENNGTNAKYILNMIDDIEKVYSNLKDYKKQEEFARMIFMDNSPFKKAFKEQLESIDADGSLWENTIQKNGIGGINIMSLMKRPFEDAINDDIKEEMNKAANYMKELQKKKFTSLNLKEKKVYLEMLGYKNGKFTKDSFLGRAFEGLKDKNIRGTKELEYIFKGFKNKLSNQMKEPHDKVFKYLVDDQFWDKNVTYVSSTSNTSIGAKMEFDLTYKGKGDTTSNASKQTKEVDVPENFNPYQTIKDNQKDVIEKLGSRIDTSRISGEVLGVNSGVISKDDLKAYDGLGNYNTYESVENKYKIVWENISIDPSSPHWVITSFRSFNNEGNEFFNIY